MTLNVSMDGSSTTSLGNPFQCFTTLIVKNFFLISSLSLPRFSLKPLPLVLSLLSLLKDCPHLSYRLPLSTEMLQLDLPADLQVQYDTGHIQNRAVYVNIQILSSIQAPNSQILLRLSKLMEEIGA